ncbi:hypothetical protein [Streptomyces sp. 8N616]|uniref:hypothetical protein n=1 Tax=Streptomyces sp. 8N616 TaxID=3457414 RepID=UPI003FD3AAC2
MPAFGTGPLGEPVDRIAQGRDLQGPAPATMTGFAALDGRLLAAHGNDGRTPRKVAHYRPLYESLLSDQPDPVLSFDTATTVTELHHTTPVRENPDSGM